MKPKFWMIVLLSVLLALLMGSGVWAAQEGSGVTAVTMVRDASGHHLNITAQLTAEDADVLRGETVYLFELYPYQNNASVASLLPIAQAQAGQKMEFTVELPQESQRLFAKFLIARKNIDSTYHVVGSGHYVDNPQVMADHTYAYPEYSSKKGLQVKMFSDAQELGISHTIINVPVNEYLLSEFSSEAYTFTYGQRDFYILREKLDYLDYRLNLCADAGIHPYLNIMLSANAASADQHMGHLYADSSVGASLYAFNMANEETVLSLEAFLSFLAQRYTDPKGTYGFAGSFIFGHEVNSNRNYYYMGEKSLDAYLNSLTAAFRVADTALRSRYANGRCYLSVGNDFNRAAINAQLDYPARDFLTAFADKIASAGDLPWGLAFTAFSSDRSITDFRQDEGITQDDSTTYISMANLEVMVEFMKTAAMRYQDEPRRMLVSSFGISSGEEHSEEDLQAALYAYAYYKVQLMPEIEALIYHRQVDSSDETGNFGLWTRVEGSFSEADRQKPLYAVLKYIDTQRSLESTAFALQKLGAADWQELIPGFDREKLTCRILLTGESVSAEQASRRGSGDVIFDFTGGNLSGFRPTDNVQYLVLSEAPELMEEEELPETTAPAETEAVTAADGTAVTAEPVETAAPAVPYALYAKMYNSTGSEYMGVGCSYEQPVSIEGGKYLRVRLKTAAPNGQERVSVMVRLYSAGNGEQPWITYECATALPVDEWSELSFDISSFTQQTDTVTGIKLWVRSADGQYHTGDYHLWLRDIALVAKAPALGIRILLWMALIVLTAVLLLALYVVIMRAINRRRGEKKRAAQQEKYRRLQEQQKLREQYRIREQQHKMQQERELREQAEQQDQPDSSEEE